ncbi:unnamed protein product, partial [Prorocentrum cordatum]
AETRAGRVIETFPIELQARFKSIRHLTDESDGLSQVIDHLKLLNGERPGDKEREAHNQALFDYAIKKGETLTDYVIRRDQQIAAAERLGLTLPDTVKARYYEERANLPPQLRLNLRTLMAGKRTVEAVRAAQLELDITERQTLPKAPAPAQARTFATTVPVLDEAGDYECDACDDNECFGLYEMEFDEQELATILISLDSQDLDEEHIMDVFAEADRLKSESSRPAAANKGSDKKPAQTSFYFNLDYDASHSGTSWAAVLDESGQVGSLSAAAATAGQVGQQERDLGQVDLEALAAATLQDMDEYALVDTAAGQALIGTPDIDKLKAAFKKKGFEIHFVDTDEVPTANGVGGKVKPVGVAAVPVSLQHCGVVEFLVLPHPCPPLLPAKFLDFLKSVIDLRRNVMTIGEDGNRRDLDLLKLPSGHRAVSLIGCKPSEFAISEDLASKFPPFVVNAGRGDVWAEIPMALQDCWVQVPGAVRRVHVGPRREPFSFAEAEPPPVPVSQSGPGRVTYQMLDSESSACSVVESIWVKGAPGEVLSFTGRWIGCAEFPIECSDQ